jgi:hypothetical protein
MPVDVLGLPMPAIELYGTCVRLKNTEFLCWGGTPEDPSGNTPRPHPYLTSDIIALGGCPIYASGVMKCWGRGTAGELGNGTMEDSPVPVIVTGFNGGARAGSGTCALTENGRAKCWGYDRNGLLGIGGSVYQTTAVPVRDSIGLELNYSNGQTGSYFTLTGWNFLPNIGVNVTINDVFITTLTINPTGSFLIFLDTDLANEGGYRIVVTPVEGNTSIAANSVGPASKWFKLGENLPYRPMEGGWDALPVPSGIGYEMFQVYLPMIWR